MEMSNITTACIYLIAIPILTITAMYDWTLLQIYTGLTMATGIGMTLAGE